MRRLFVLVLPGSLDRVKRLLSSEQLKPRSFDRVRRWKVCLGLHPYDSFDRVTSLVWNLGRAKIMNLFSDISVQLTYACFSWF